jgi:hypothetical protein
MKSICFIAIVIVLLLATASDAQDKMPTQVRSARSRYDAAVKTAVDPIRVRYLDELNRMRSAAMAQKNLDLANAIDAEITAVSSETARNPDGLASSLVGTTWSWGVSEAAAGSILRFLEKGAYRINNDLPGKYDVDNETTIKLDNGTVLKFDRAFRSYEGKTGKGEPRAGRKQ